MFSHMYVISLPTLSTLKYVDTLAKCHVSAYWANIRGPPHVSRCLASLSLENEGCLTFN